MSVADTPNPPERIPPMRLTDPTTPDLFVCDVVDAALKDLMPTLEHPFYSLSKKPSMAIREYTRGDNWLRIIPSGVGQATIYDKDILLYAISQVVAARNMGIEPKKRVRINSYDFLKFSRRNTGGKDYNSIEDAVTRLRGTQIQTNIRTGDEEEFNTFGLIEGGTVRRKYGLNGRLLWVEIVLSDWVFNAIKANEVLTLHPDYFSISRPIERRLYEIARKHCGQKAGWSAYTKTLYEKSGSGGSLRQFREYLREICKTDKMPDYELLFDAENDMVIFTNRKTMPADKARRAEKAADILMLLSFDIDERARPLIGRWDSHIVKDRFAVWWYNIGMPKVKNPDAFFLKFCSSWLQKNGQV